MADTGSTAVDTDTTTVDKRSQLDVTFVVFISLLLVAQHVSCNHVPVIRSWRLRDVIVSCWYVPWLQEGCQDRLAGSASIWTSRSRQLLMMGTWLHETCWATSRRETKNRKVTSSWFFLSTLNYDTRSTTIQICKRQTGKSNTGVRSVYNFLLSGL